MLKYAIGITAAILPNLNGKFNKHFGIKYLHTNVLFKPLVNDLK